MKTSQSNHKTKKPFALLTVRVDPGVHSELHVLARSQDLTLAQMLRRLCAAALREGRKASESV
jgi:hypothetical protein